MPRGVYVRKPRMYGSVGVYNAQRVVRVENPEPETQETDDQILQRLNDRFEVLDDLTRGAISGEIRAMIVSGPPGLGKSYTIETIMDEWDPSGDFHSIVRGYVRPPSLYRLLHRHREHGQVLIFDDADSIFDNEYALNLLKAACDTNKKRIISYMTEAKLVDEEEGEPLPKSFEFHGSIIFITNRNFDNDIARGHRYAPHMEAMISRSHYVDLAMHTVRDYMMQIKRVVEGGLLKNMGLSDEQQEEVMNFIQNNNTRLRELSLRIVLKVAAIRLRNADHRWEKTARVTTCVSGRG